MSDIKIFRTMLDTSTYIVVTPGRSRGQGSVEAFTSSLVAPYLAAPASNDDVVGEVSTPVPGEGGGIEGGSPT